MAPTEIFLFLKAKTWEFYAVEAAHSDDALMKCLKDKGWELSGLIYLGRLEGTLPQRRDQTWVDGPRDYPRPPMTQEPHQAWKTMDLTEAAT